MLWNIFTEASIQQPKEMLCWYNLIDRIIVGNLGFCFCGFCNFMVLLVNFSIVSCDSATIMIRLG